MLKKVKKILMLLLVISTIMLPSDKIFAISFQHNSDTASSAESLENTGNLHELSDLKMVDQFIEIEYDGMYEIKSIETVYDVQNTGKARICSTASYQKQYVTKEYTISYNGVKLFHILLDADFKYNGTYAYVSDKEAFWTSYNNSSFTKTSSAYTSSSNKSKKAASYVLKGVLKNKKYGINETHTFKLKCTPTGKTSASAN